MARIVFFCHDSMHNIRSMEYYRQDIEALRALGHEVVVANRYRDIPWRFDVMFVWWWTYALVPVLLARLTGRIAIITGTFNFRHKGAAKGGDFFARPWWQRLVIGWATKAASANLFVGRKELAAVPAHFNIGGAHYAPHAVGDDYFAVAAADNLPRTLLLNLAWSGPENLERKGVWTILDASALLKRRGRAFELVLAGKRGEAFPALEHRIAELGLGDYVRAIGEVTQDEKLDLFARTKLYLQPSYFEGFGLATAEAAAAGCCVVTTDVGEVRTVMSDGAFYVEPGDAAGLADAIDRLLADPALVAELNAAAQHRIQSLYSTAAKRAGFERIFRALRIVDPAAETGGRL